MALSTAPSPTPAPVLSERARRAWKILTEHERRMAANGLREFYCQNCTRLIGHYAPPVALFLWPCQHCGVINKAFNLT